MEDKKQELFQMMPKGSFESFDEFSSFIDSEGYESVFDAIKDKGYFESQEEYVSYFNTETQKKKDQPNATESPSTSAQGQSSLGSKPVPVDNSFLTKTFTPQDFGINTTEPTDATSVEVQQPIDDKSASLAVRDDVFKTMSQISKLDTSFGNELIDSEPFKLKEQAEQKASQLKSEIEKFPKEVASQDILDNVNSKIEEYNKTLSDISNYNSELGNITQEQDKQREPLIREMASKMSLIYPNEEFITEVDGQIQPTKNLIRRVEEESKKAINDNDTTISEITGYSIIDAPLSSFNKMFYNTVKIPFGVASTMSGETNEAYDFLNNQALINQKINTDVKAKQLTQEEIEGGIIENTLKGNYKAAATNLGIDVLNTIPQVFVAAYSPSVYLNNTGKIAVGQVVKSAVAPKGLAYNGVSTGVLAMSAEKSEESYNQAIEDGLNPAQATALSTFKGLTTVLAESFFTKDLQAIKGTNAGVDLAKEILKNKGKAVKDVIKQYPKQFADAGGEEMFEEMSENTLDAIADYLSTGKPINPYEIADASLVGLVSGGGSSMVGNTKSLISVIRTDPNILNLQKQVGDIDRYIENNDLTNQQVEALEFEKKSVIGKLNKYTNESNELINSMTDEDKNTYIKTSQELAQKLDVIQGLPDGDIKDNMKEEANNLLDSRTELLGKYKQEVQEVDSEQDIFDFAEDELAQLENEIAKAERIARDRKQPERKPKTKQASEPQQSKPVFALDVIGETFVNEEGVVGTIKEENGGVIWESKDGTKVIDGGGAQNVDIVTINDMKLSFPKTTITAPVQLTEGEPAPQAQPRVTQAQREEIELMTEIELEDAIAKAEKDVADFESEVTQEAAKQAQVDRLIFPIGGKKFAVRQKPDGTFTVSQENDKGKFVVIKDGDARKQAIDEYNNLKKQKESDALSQAIELSEEFKKEQDDKILNWLDNAIDATSSKGRAFDATLGLPMFVANSSLKIVKAAYKAGNSLNEAIQDGLKYLKDNGYTVNELDFKKYVLEEGRKKPQVKPDPENKPTPKQKPTAKPTAKESPKAKSKVEPDVDSKKKRAITNLAKKVLAKFNKGAFITANNEVSSILGQRIHAIENKKLFDEVEVTLKGLLANKVNPNELKDLALRVKKEINRVEDNMEANDLSINKIEKSLENIPDRIKAINADDFSLESLRGARSRFTRILNDLRKNEEAVRLLSDLEYSSINNAEEILDKINNLRSDLVKESEKYSDNLEASVQKINKENKETANKLKVSDVTDDPLSKDDVADFLEEISEVEFEDANLASMVNVILEDLKVGFIPIGLMSDIKNELRSENQVKSPNFKKAADNINEMPKESKNFVLRFLQHVDVRRKAKTSLSEWVNEARSREFAQWEFLTGTFQNPVFVKVVDDYISRVESYQESVAETLSGMEKAFAIPFKEKVSNIQSMVDALMKKQKPRVKVGMILMERFWQTKYGESYIDKMMGDSNLLDKINNESKRDAYQDAWESLPKKADGTLDIGKAINKLSPSERKIFNFSEKQFKADSELARKQMIANAKRGIPFVTALNYFPINRTLDGQSSDVSIDDLGDILNPQAKISSTHGLEQRSKAVTLVELDMFNVLSEYSHQVNRDFHLTDPIRMVNKFFNKAMDNTSGTARTAMEAFKKAFHDNVKHTFKKKHYGVMDKLIGASYVVYLVNATRSLVTEPIAEGTRTAMIGEYNSRMFKDTASSLDAAIKDSIAKIKGIKYEDGVITTTGEFRSNFKKLLQLTNSPYNRQFSRQFVDGSVRITAQQKKSTTEKVTDFIVGLPNRATLIRAWMPAFNNEFKKLTGVDIDYSKLDDDSYVNQYRKSIKDAGAYANYKTALIKGYTSMAGARTMNKFFNFHVDALKYPTRFKLNQFMSSFGNRDAFLFKESLRDIGLLLSQKALGDGMGIDIYKNATDQAMGKDYNALAKGIQGIVGLTVGGAIYPLLSDIMSYLYIMDDDEDDLEEWQINLKKSIESGEYFKPANLFKHVASYYVFMATSKYGYASRVVTLAIGGSYVDKLRGDIKNTKSKEEKKELQQQIDQINSTSRSLFFSEPINLNVFGNSYGRESKAREVAKAVPGASLALDFASDLAQAGMLVKEEYDQDDELARASGIMIYELIKSMALARGTAIPATKDFDKQILKVKKDIEEDNKKKKGGSNRPARPNLPKPIRPSRSSN